MFLKLNLTKLKLTKIIITLENNFFSFFKDKYKLTKLSDTNVLEVYAWERLSGENEEEIVLIYWDDEEKIVSYIKENHDVFKIVIVWSAHILSSIDLKPWDVILPNTFLYTESKDAVFLDYAIWENYDLKKFWLFLSWVCLTGKSENKGNFEADIIDDKSYKVLFLLKQYEILEKEQVRMYGIMVAITE